MKKNEDIPVHVLPDVEFLASDKPLAFGEASSSHRIKFYAIVWYLEDHPGQLIDFEKHPIRKNLVYLIGKNQVHSIPGNTLPSGRVIVFSQAFFDRIDEIHLRQLFLPFDNTGIELKGTAPVLLEALFSLILAEQHNDEEYALMLKYTTAFLLHIHRSVKDASDVLPGDTRLVRLYELITEHFREERSTEFYASAIGLSAKRINELLREKTGVTINQLIAQLLLIESKRELFLRFHSIKEIAYRLGFTDQSYFSRFFRKHSGTTPERFRDTVHELL
ncbi:MAG: AraC family transcriptional regulator [Flavitalea sp.]